MGWTWDYLHNGISWAVVQRIMADLPSYEYAKEEDDLKLNNENAENIMNYINTLM